MEPEPDISPAQIGGFRVLRRLSSGATTDVLLARAEGPHGFERVVALKVLLQQFQSDPAFERMFAREASAYARLSHPAIVKLYDFFGADGQLVMVLEYVDGLPLHKLRAMLSIGGERFDDSASLFIGSRIFAALGAAHSARDPENGEFAPVIHRDINPSNVLVPWDGHVKISDFGIAKIGSAQGDTRLGFVKGTYGYMAPEQVRGESVTVRADVYAASILLWELLARRKAIQRGALPEVEVLKAMAKPEIPSLDALRPELSAEVRDAIRRGLEPDPDRRSITADEMAGVLRLAMSGDEGRARLAEAIARVRPPSSDRGLAVTRAHPTAEPGAEPPSSNRGASKSRSELMATLKSDPDETSRMAAGSIPDDSGAFKRVEVAIPPGLSRAVEEPPKSSGDLTVIEARRPAPSEPPPTEPPGSEPGTQSPETLPLPNDEPRTDAREPAQGFVRTSPMPEQPSTLRFGTSEPPPPTTQDPVVVPPAPAVPAVTASQPVAKVTLVSRPAPVEPPALPAVAAASEPSDAPAAEAPLPRFPMPAPDAPLPAVAKGPPPLPAEVAAAKVPAAADTVPRAVSAARPTVRTKRSSSSAGKIAAVVIGSALVGVGGVELFLRLQATDDPGDPTTVVTSRPQTTLPAAPPVAQAPVPRASIPPAASPPPPAASSVAAAAAPSPAPSAPPSVAPALPSASAVPSPPAASATPPPPEPTGRPAGADPVAAAARTGDILTKPSAGGHRVYVDDRVVGNSPDPVSVRCGPHTVRIGSAGTPRDVDVPCGGSIVVNP